MKYCRNCSKKVYCKDCKWFKYAIYHREGGWNGSCLAPTGKIIIDYSYGNYKERINLSPVKDSKKYPNKNGECQYYSRKWWKFWVKE